MRERGRRFILSVPRWRWTAEGIGIHPLSLHGGGMEPILLSIALDHCSRTSWTWMVKSLSANQHLFSLLPLPSPGPIQYFIRHQWPFLPPPSSRPRTDPGQPRRVRFFSPLPHPEPKEKQRELYKQILTAPHSRRRRLEKKGGERRKKKNFLEAVTFAEK